MYDEDCDLGLALGFGGVSRSSREWSQSVWLVLVGLDVRRLVSLMWAVDERRQRFGYRLAKPGGMTSLFA